MPRTLALPGARAIVLLGAIALPIIVLACTTAEQINPAITAFAAASDKMASSLRTDQLPAYRRNLRQDLFVADIVDLSNGPMWSESDAEKKARKVPVAWLCEPNYLYDRIALPLAAIDARDQVLTDRTKAPSDDLVDLLQALGKSYAVPGEKDVFPQDLSYSAWIVGQGKKCSALLDTGDPYVTRTQSSVEFLAAALAAVSLIETVWTVAKPVVVGALKTVDMERRAAALKAYFSDDNNVKILTAQFQALENFVADELATTQKKAAGTATATSMMLYDMKAAHWVKIRQIATSQSCTNLVTAKLDSIHRKTCMDAFLDAASKPLTAALDAADKFDSAAAKQLPEPKDRLSTKVGVLRKVALGEQASEDELKGLMATVVRYIALFQAIGDATSAANQKKIGDALTALQKAGGT